MIEATELEEQIMLQKSKINLLKVGDGNNAYFHATISGKNKHIGIYKLEDHNGQTITDPKEIETEVLRFYGDLISKSSQDSTHIIISLMGRLNTKDRLAKFVITTHGAFTFCD